MMDLCAKLSAHSISTVRKYVENLRYYVKPPVDGSFLDNFFVETYMKTQLNLMF